MECEDYADIITAERVRRVINGVPGAKDKSLREGLGGSFTYCTLGPPIDIEGMITGKALPSYSSLAAYVLHTASGISAGSAELPATMMVSSIPTAVRTTTCFTGPISIGCAATRAFCT